MADNKRAPASQEKSQQVIHRKSRLGCKICKARKIKCDEVRPVCGNCYKRFPNPGEYCEFDDVPQPPYARSVTLSVPVEDFPGRFSSARTMELRLFHHFSTVTCFTMPTCEEAAGLRMWRDVIPSLAFECPYIYSAILAIAALHLMSSPDDKALRAAAYQYMNETVSAHREEITRVDSSHALNRFIASVLLAVHTMLRARYEANSDVVYTIPVHYFVLQLGSRDLYHQDYDMGDEVKDYITCYSHLAPRHQAVKPPETHNHRYINQNFPSDPLPDFINSESAIDPDRKRAYGAAIAYTSMVKECILRGENASWIQHRIGIAPCRFGEDFCAFMQEGDPICLVLLARLYALYKFVDFPWWLQGTAEYEVHGLSSLVPQEWEWAMEWPLGIVDDYWKYVGDMED